MVYAETSLSRRLFSEASSIFNKSITNITDQRHKRTLLSLSYFLSAVMICLSFAFLNRLPRLQSLLYSPRAQASTKMKWKHNKYFPQYA